MCINTYLKAKENVAILWHMSVSVEYALFIDCLELVFGDLI